MFFDASPALMRINIRDFIRDYDLAHLAKAITEKAGHAILYLVGQPPAPECDDRRSAAHCL